MFYKTNILRAHFITGIFLCLSVAATWGQKAGFTVNNVVIAANQTIDVCVGSTVNFKNNVTDGIKAVRWRFDSGSPDTSTSRTSISVVYNSADTGTAIQTITRNDDTEDSLKVTIRVNSFPKARFFFTPVTLECGSTNFKFTGTFSNTPLKYNWRFGDGGTATTANPTYQFINAIGDSGTTTYYVKLVVIKNSVCADSIIRPITIKKVPDLTLTSSDSSIVVSGRTFKKCVSVPAYTFDFVNKSRTDNKQYQVRWGDGSADSLLTIWPFGTNIKHTYTIGTYTMRVTATGGGPNNCPVTKFYTVFLGPSPKVGLDDPGNTNICVNDSIRFPVNKIIRANPRGTIYSLFVNDSTPVQNFTSAPISVTHLFPSGSCGKTSKGINNSFAATMNAVNPCGSDSVQVLPIYVSGKALANATISPSNKICVYNEVTITNSTDWGGQISVTAPNTSDCSQTPGKSVWVITPSDGYILNSGVLGSLNGAVLNPDIWDSSGSSELKIQFTRSGVYRIKLYSSNSRCPMVDSIEQEICVRNPAAASFTMDNKIACAPAVVNITNTSPTGPCGGEKYKWNVSYSDVANCGYAGGSAFINNTTGSSKDPQVSFSTPGRYIIELLLSTDASGCNAVIARDTFFVKASPSVTIDSIRSICIGDTIIPLATVKNCYATQAVIYNWQFIGGLPASSTNEITGSIFYSRDGSFPIKVEVANECGTSIASTTMVVGQYPTVDIGAGSTVVAGSEIQFNPSLTNGPYKKYTWNPATWLSCSDCPNPVATINNNISYQLMVENIYGCIGSDTINYKVLCSKEDQVYIPNAFSPDGDGINDVFMLHGKGVKVDFFRVYSRWGELVFDGGSNYRVNEPASGWNGKIYGKPAAQDVYVYSVQVHCTAGGTFNYKGNISLLYLR